jgi:hypothetical protein
MRNKYATHVDFTFLTDVLDKKIPSNIDMVLERKGYFLIGEWKRLNESISQGQMILLKALANISGFTVLIVTGHSDNEQTEVHLIHRLNASGEMEEWGNSIDDLKKIVHNWFKWAN